jgi:hypothetical protein
LGFEVVAPSSYPERKSNSGAGELSLERTRLVLLNKKNIYTVFVKNVKEVIFQEMLQAPVEIDGLSGCIPILNLEFLTDERYLHYLNNNPGALFLALNIFGAVLYMVRIPKLFSPGTFDLIISRVLHDHYAKGASTKCYTS